MRFSLLLKIGAFSKQYVLMKLNDYDGLMFQCNLKPFVFQGCSHVASIQLNDCWRRLLFVRAKTLPWCQIHCRRD